MEPSAKIAMRRPTGSLCFQFSGNDGLTTARACSSPVKARLRTRTVRLPKLKPKSMNSVDRILRFFAPRGSNLNDANGTVALRHVFFTSANVLPSAKLTLASQASLSCSNNQTCMTALSSASSTNTSKERPVDFGGRAKGDRRMLPQPYFPFCMSTEKRTEPSSSFW